jgi:hypothetical protein
LLCLAPPAGQLTENETFLAPKLRRILGALLSCPANLRWRAETHFFIRVVPCCNKIMVSNGCDHPLDGILAELYSFLRILDAGCCDAEF